MGRREIPGLVIFLYMCQIHVPNFTHLLRKIEAVTHRFVAGNLGRHVA